MNNMTKKVNINIHHIPSDIIYIGIPKKVPSDVFKPSDWHHKDYIEAMQKDGCWLDMNFDGVDVSEVFIPPAIMKESIVRLTLEETKQ